jgi:hypothetical protein
MDQNQFAVTETRFVGWFARTKAYYKVDIEPELEFVPKEENEDNKWRFVSESNKNEPVCINCPICNPNSVILNFSWFTTPAIFITISVLGPVSVPASERRMVTSQVPTLADLATIPSDKGIVPNIAWRGGKL